MTEQEIEDLSQIKNGYDNNFIGDSYSENFPMGVPANEVVGNGIPFTEVTFFSKMPFKKFIDKMICKIKGHKILIDLEAYKSNGNFYPTFIGCYRCKRQINLYYFLKIHFS